MKRSSGRERDNEYSKMVPLYIAIFIDTLLIHYVCDSFVWSYYNMCTKNILGNIEHKVDYINGSY